MPANGTQTIFEVKTNIDKSTKKTGNHRASSQHYKNKKGASLSSVFFYANHDFHLFLSPYFYLFFPYA